MKNKKYEVEYIKGTNRNESVYDTLAKAIKRAQNIIEGNCAAYEVQGIHDHTIAINEVEVEYNEGEYDIIDNSEKEIARIELPTHEDYSGDPEEPKRDSDEWDEWAHKCREYYINEALGELQRI